MVSETNEPLGMTPTCLLLLFTVRVRGRSQFCDGAGCRGTVRPSCSRCVVGIAALGTDRGSDSTTHARADAGACACTIHRHRAKSLVAWYVPPRVVSPRGGEVRWDGTYLHTIPWMYVGVLTESMETPGKQGARRTMHKHAREDGRLQADTWECGCSSPTRLTRALGLLSAYFISFAYFGVPQREGLKLVHLLLLLGFRKAVLTYVKISHPESTHPPPAWYLLSPPPPSPAPYGRAPRHQLRHSHSHSLTHHRWWVRP